MLTSSAQVRRAIALVIDDLALSWQDLVHTRDALKRYIEQTSLQFPAPPIATDICP